MKLTWTLPAAMCDFVNLTRLDLSNTSLPGTFPGATLYRCSQLRFLDLANNTLHGALPRDIGNLSPVMEHLNLSWNSFSGDFPEKIWLLPELEWVVIENNNFTGALPAVISPNIQRIEMGNIMFSGSIPRTAIKLSVFTAENNQLDGEL
uniref:Leucine-rich repeat-containing N-terminal plant-type domain-containing protein n=1 Tax=Oryza glumipatula TaxID=40148 RepID=A0A0E0AAW3_9ORYZ